MRRYANSLARRSTRASQGVVHVACQERQDELRTGQHKHVDVLVEALSQRPQAIRFLGGRQHVGRIL